MLRAAFLGNVANTHFRCATALLERGIDAHVFVSRSDAAGSRPENDEPALAAGYPEWIHEGDWITPQSLLAPWRAPITRRLAEFDVVVASGPGPIFAQFAGPPWAFYVTGGDLTVKPFPLTFWRWYPNLPHRAAELVAGAWQRRAARRADRVWMQEFEPTVDAANRLGVPTDARSPLHFPIVIDVAAFGPASGDRAAERWADDAVGESDFAVFHPSRLVMDATPDLVRTGQWKGNDVLLRGFARFVRDTGATDARLVLPDRAHSRDVESAKSLVRSLGIEEQVRWLVPPDGTSFDQAHMRALYRRSDIVADEFGVGWFGYVTLEGLASGRPVLCHLDERVMATMYPEHPILDAADESHVARLLSELHADPERRRALGAAGRRWVGEHHSADAAAAVYVEAIAELATTRIGAP